METDIRSCDTRQRIEYQLFVTGKEELALRQIVWRLDNDSDFVADSEFNSYTKNLPEAFSTLGTIGCQTTFSRFINTHRPDFNTLDSLVKKLISEIPDVMGGDDFSTVSLRNPEDLRLIETFVSNTWISPKPTPAAAPRIYISPTAAVTPTQLDEPTIEKKTEIVQKSSRPWLFLYFLLPVAVLVGLAIHILDKQRRK